MLAVTANWLFTDGSLAPAYAAGADSWLHSIRRAVIRAGLKSDGRYEPVETVSLVFAGDTFDWLLSDIWSGRERPWHGGPRSREARSRVVARSLRAGRPILAGLRRWIRRGIPVPAVDGHGRPSVRNLVYAPVRVVMLSGDRDAWASEEFGAHDNSTHRLGAWVGDGWSDDEITIRHGHDRDPVTHVGAAPMAAAAGRAPSLAESIAVDLVVPFAMALEAEASGWHLVRRRVGAIAAAGLLDMPQLVAAMIGLWGGATASGRRVALSWRRCVAAWWTIARQEPPASETEHDVLDAVAAWLEAAVERHDAPLPPAIARLALSRCDSEEPGTILGHMPIEGRRPSCGPWLTIVKPTGSLELLGPATSEPPVVTIGVTGGERIVEAA